MNEKSNTYQELNQSEVFLKSEGDAWFKRNHDSISSKKYFYETDTIKRVLCEHKDSIKKILEIGCGNGAKLNDLCSFFGADGYGIDPSALAVDTGTKTFPNQKLTQSLASSLPYDDEFYDLVYFGFCLYLVDRNDLFKSLAEADRVLKPGGFLAILDFDPKLRHRRAYLHKPGLFSYKNSYPEFFTSCGHYYLVAKESFSHEANHFSKDSDERVSVSVLYKELDAY